VSGEQGGKEFVKATPAPAARAPLGSWARVYAVVIAALVVDIALLWWLTERYR
jgi:hypothetical protein